MQEDQETEIRIVAENILKTRNKLNEILAANTGKSVEEIARDTERDNYMTAQEALAYGLIDGIVERDNMCEGAVTYVAVLCCLRRSYGRQKCRR